MNLRGVFAPSVVDRLIGLSREAGLWDLNVPKGLGGGGLGLLGQVVVEEQSGPRHPDPRRHGETLELPLTLFYRLLRHAQVGGGTSEIHRMLIARSLLR